MIQRIQTLYLFIIVILMSQVFIFPFATFFNEHETLSFNALQTSTNEYMLPIAILFSVIIFIAFITIFLYKNRLLQVRLTVVNILLLIGSIALVGYFFWQIYNQMVGYKVQYNFTCTFPFISIILSFLAIRSIKKDEALVRSVNRIR